ncbi:MAG: glucose-1-phosphate thymidylyltransferase RfbA [Myxococcales bacterium]|nr:glucose-1-phosphate thymidylyltransferase RfbA [Myxococcales bacterium]
MKGILLAGGAGSRLYPLTEVACKQLVPVYDKPMVYYPLTTLIDSGVRELCLISTPVDLPRFERLFGDGSRLGLRIGYREQARPAGIAEALLIAEDFVGKDSVALILGDNVFYAGDALARAFRDYASGATIFGYQVKNPERYGVVELDDAGRVLSIEEKPARPKSNHAIPGLYLFDARAAALARQLRPSARGELEITDLIRNYLEQGELRCELLARGTAWLDAGTSSSLHEASAFVQTVEKRQGIKLGCPEEAAFRRGYIDAAALARLIAAMPACEYREYLASVLAEARR